jgi:DHA2 family methylenomycin A resistance protein-like MFS transporter
MNQNTGTFSPLLAWIVTATSFSFVVVQMDVTIVNVALPRIGTELHAGVDALQWIVDAYTLAFAVLLLSAGVLGDRFGSRRAYQLGFLIFAAASAACGLAPNIATLVAARAVQGVGAALLVPNSLALLNHATAHTAAIRARAVGLWTAAGAISIAAGPVIGSLLLASLGWRSIFLVNLPLCALGMWLTAQYVPAAPPAPARRGLDPLGQLLVILSLTSLTAAVIEYRSLGLTHPLVWGGLALALLSGAGFIWNEARTPEPMLPLRFFRMPNFSAAVVFGVVMNLTYYGTIFALTLYLQQAHGYSAVQAGLAYLPLTGGFFLSNVVAGRMVARVGSRPPMIVGACVGAAGYFLLLRLDAHSSWWAMLPAFLLIPAGMGLAVPAMTTAILASVEKHWSGTASAVLNAARQAGGAIGVAIFGALVSGGAQHIVGGLASAALASGILLLLAAVLAWSGIHASPGAAKGTPARAA